MKLRIVVILAACMALLAPASAVSLLAAAAAAKGLVLGAGLTAALSSSGSETVVIQTQPGSSAQVVPANQVVLQEYGNSPAIHTAQTYTYSISPLSRLWGAISNLISAKAKAIGNAFSPHRVVVIVPKETTTTTTTTTTTKKPTTTTKRPLISIDIENQKPQPPSIDIDIVNQKPQFPSLDIDIGHGSIIKPKIDVSSYIRRVPIMVNYGYIKK